MNKIYLKCLLMVTVSVLYVQNSNALFQKRLGYRTDDNRPPFLNEDSGSGVFYFGGNFFYGAGRINDTRSLGMDNSYNKAMYDVETVKAYPESADFSKTISKYQSGNVVIGYSPMSGILGSTRHEIEFGVGSFGDKYSGINENNLFTVDDVSYNSINYDIKQKYAMYNLYIHSDKSKVATFFTGAGIGIMSTQTKLSGIVDASSGGNESTDTESEIYTSKNMFSTVVSAFIGGTYDISDSIVMQGKIKGMIVSNGSKKSDYTDEKYAGQHNMMTLVGIEVGVLFGM